MRFWKQARLLGCRGQMSSRINLKKVQLSGLELVLGFLFFSENSTHFESGLLYLFRVENM